MAEINYLANHLRTHHNLQIAEVQALDNDQIKLTVKKALAPRANRRKANVLGKGSHVKIKF